MLYWTPKFVTQDGSFILWYSNNFSFSPFFSFFFLFPYFLPACNDGQLLAKVGQVSGCSGRQKMEPPPSSPLICPKSTKRNYSKHAERHKTLQFLLLLEQFFSSSFLSLSLVQGAWHGTRPPRCILFPPIYWGPGHHDCV